MAYKPQSCRNAMNRQDYSNYGLLVITLKTAKAVNVVIAFAYHRWPPA